MRNIICKLGGAQQNVRMQSGSAISLQNTHGISILVEALSDGSFTIYPARAGSHLVASPRTNALDIEETP